MHDGFDLTRFDRLTLIDEHLYDAYRRSQRSTEMEEQRAIEAQIRDMQRQRSQVLEGMLSMAAQR